MVTLVPAWCQQVGKFYQLSSKESGGCDTSNSDTPEIRLDFH